jgi:hemerythrin superfamily protein
LDPLELLKGDHQQVRSLLEQLKTRELATRRMSVEELERDLLLHGALEEELIYPILIGRAPELENDIVWALEEHDLVKVLLAELEEIGIDHPRHLAKIKVLESCVLAHVKREETVLLPRLAQLLQPEERELLAQKLQEAETWVLTRATRPVRRRAAAKRPARRTAAKRAPARRTASKRNVTQRRTAGKTRRQRTRRR